MNSTSTTTQITHDFPPFFKVYKDGQIERYMFFNHVPSGLVDSETGVQSKDVLISSEIGIKARIFIPKLQYPDQKFPLLVHYHGGGFCIGSPFDYVTQNFLSCFVYQANFIAISIDYGLAPEHLLPTGFEDSWVGLRWVLSHSNGSGPESLLNKHVDFDRVFVAGESAGATIAHYVAVQAGVIGLGGLKITGLFIIHPFFGDEKGNKLYMYMYPSSAGFNGDPILNPAVDPNLLKLGCEKVFVCVAEKDFLKSRGEYYYKVLVNSGWGGKVEFYESKGEDHCFHIIKKISDEREVLIKKFVDFMMQD